MNRSHIAPAVAAAVVFASLVACGGSGGDEAQAAAPGVGTPATGATDIGCGSNNFEAEALRLVNQKRAAGAACGARGSFAPAPALAWHAALANAAYGHALDMAQHDFFSHTGSDGRSLGTRVSAAGYAWSSVGENIAAGPTTPQLVVDGWMTSDGHCANLMNPGYRHMGLACARRAGSTYGSYWTLDLASPR